MKRLTRGYSLVEVTVAIAIIALLVTATGMLLQRLPVISREVRDQDVALRIARDELEVLRALGYVSLPASGSFGNALLVNLASSSAAVAVTDYNEKTKEVVATVSWRGALGMRTLSLTTLITEGSALP